eukprot:1145262-Pelagomonas_calceolata.AAC.4
MAKQSAMGSPLRVGLPAVIFASYKEMELPYAQLLLLFQGHGSFKPVQDITIYTRDNSLSVRASAKSVFTCAPNDVHTPIWPGQRAEQSGVNGGKLDVAGRQAQLCAWRARLDRWGP